MSGRFERKYAVEWYELLETAHFDHGMPVTRAVELAAKGELPGQTEPFEMKLASARRHMTVEKQRRAGRARTAKEQGPPEARMEAYTARLMAQVEHRLSKVEDRAKRGKERDTDPDEIRKLADAAKSITLLIRQGAKTTERAAAAKPESPPTNGNGQEPPSELVKDMVRDMEAADVADTEANSEQRQKDDAGR